MPIAAATPSPPSLDQPADVSDSDPEELDDDEEYEEIEIEEEIEVEEEVSEEDQVEEEDPEEVEEEEEDEEDPEMVEEEEEEVEQDEEVQEEDDPEKEEFVEELSPIDDDHGAGEISHMDDDSKAPVLDCGILDADPINPFNVSVKEVSAAVSVSMVDGFNEEANDVLYPKDENKREAVQNGDEISQVESRSDVFIRPSSLSPGLKIKEGNEQPAVISHTDDDSKAPVLDSGLLDADPINLFDASSVKEVSAAVSVLMLDGFNEEANGISYPKDENKRKAVQNGDETSRLEPRSDVFIRPSSVSPGQKIMEGNKRPAVICDFFSKGWCIKGNSCRFLHVRDHKEDSSEKKEGSEAFVNPKSETESQEGLIEGAEGSRFSGVADAAATERIPPWDKRERPSWKSESSELQDKDNPRTIEFFKAVEKKSQNCYLDRSNSPVSTNNGTFSSSSVQSLDIYGGDKVSSYAMTSQLTSGISQSNHGSAWARQPFSFSSSSWSTDPMGTLRHLDDGKGIGNSRSASLHQSSSPLNCFESENLSRSYGSGDTLHSAGYRTIFSSSDWEPSTPFRPSFPITQSLLSLACQYDPICDGIEQPNIGNKFSRFSSSSQETSILREHSHPNLNTALTGTFSQELSSNKLSHASPQNICESNVENSQGDDLFTSKTETAGIAAYEPENETILAKEDTFLISSHDRDMKKASEVRSDRDFLLQKDGSRHKETKVDGHSQNNEVDSIKGDLSIQRESRALKLFRGALIDFVKELVKPTWREGNLSKDAHKVIVKKTVDKVLNALPPDQIPSTPEYIEMYLCLSQPKITKVVEVYVDKYGKL